MRSALPLCAIATLVTIASPRSATAQIAPDTTPTTTLNTTVEYRDRTITIQGGEQSNDGANLFHSFAQFGLEADQVADFVTPFHVENVLGRITGGDASVINGTLQVTGSSADLFLINPAGIVFGEAARLNVAGDFTATTADSIGFTAGWFDAIDAANRGELADLTAPTNLADLVGDPIALDFAGGASSAMGAGAIVNHGVLAVRGDASVNLIGGLVIHGGSLSGETVSLTAVNGRHTLRLSPDGYVMSLDVPSDRLVGNTITPIALPELLTGGNVAIAESLETVDGVVRLSGVAIEAGAIEILDQATIVTSPATPIAAPQQTARPLFGGLSGSTSGILAELTGSEVSTPSDDDSSASTSSASPTSAVAAIVTSNTVNAVNQVAESLDTSSSTTSSSTTSSSTTSNSTTSSSTTSSEPDLVVESVVEPVVEPVINPAVATIATIVEPVAETIQSPVRETAAATTGDAVSNVSNTVDAVEPTLNTAIEPVTTAIDRALDVSNAINNIENTVSDGVNNGLTTATSVANAGVQEIVTTANGTVANVIETASGTGQALTNTVGNVAENVTDNVVGGVVDSAVGDVMNSTVGVVDSAVGGVVGNAVDSVGDVVAGTGEAIATLTETLTETTILSPLGEVIRDTTTGVADVVAATNIVTQSTEAISDLVSNTTTVLPSALPSAIADNAPSGVGADSSGTNNTTLDSSLDSASPAAPAITLESVENPEVRSTIARPPSDSSVSSGAALSVSSVLSPEPLTTTSQASAMAQLQAQLQIDSSINPNITSNIGSILGADTLEPTIQQAIAPTHRDAAMLGSDSSDSSNSANSANSSNSANSANSSNILSFVYTPSLNPTSFGDVLDLDTARSLEYTTHLQLEADLKGDMAATREAMAMVEAATGMRTGVVYLSSNPEQITISLVTAVSDPLTATVPVDHATVMHTVNAYRQQLTNSRMWRTGRHNHYAAQLYDWLIRPIAAELTALDVDTLMFSMSEGLRSLPMAALYDGDQYLVEHYSLSLIPSIGLIDTRYQPLQASDPVLATGASEFHDLAPLPAVPAELDALVNYRRGGAMFLNEAFTRQNLIAERDRRPYPIVHLATHGEFSSGDLSNSYIQLWDERIGLNQIRELGWHRPAVELLVLSACRTALGNAEAEMGFAGFAVAAGVKTAIASLWYVDDNATFLLMTELYNHLATAPIKAEALRNAQLALINGDAWIENGLLYTADSLGNPTEPIALSEEFSDLADRDFSHPYYWSAFTTIGAPW